MKLNYAVDAVGLHQPRDAVQRAEVAQRRRGVRASLAYVLNLGDIVPGDFALSDRNIAEVQKLHAEPQRRSRRTTALWPARAIGNGGRPTNAVACMKDCASRAARCVVRLPDFARDQHGNLAEQNRRVGAQRGADTTGRRAPRGEARLAAHGAEAAAPGTVPATGVTPKRTVRRVPWLSRTDRRPRVCRDVARKYDGRADAVAYLPARSARAVRRLWGAIPMPAQPP